jgi:very-short-patch-repair endonuclease
MSPLSRRRIPYDSRSVSRARKLRKQGILSEVLFWNQLRSRRLRGYKFFRQKPIGPYIVDFFCEELFLIIEIDGYSHQEKDQYDKDRDHFLRSFNFHIVHFRDEDIRKNLTGVLLVIEKWIDKSIKNIKGTPPLNPPSMGE